MAVSSQAILATGPLGYHRIISPTLKIPTEPSIPVQVGLLACQRDPLLQHLKTNVIACVPSQGLEAPKDKKKKTPPSETYGKLYEVLLQDTILFPEGGGQPSDFGVIKSQDGVAWDVLEVRRRGGHAIHYVEGSDITPLSLTPGSLATVLLGERGYERRYDNMCMHTSQHLISALLETHLNCSTPSWYLTQFPNPAYIEVPRAPTAEQLKTIEEAANKYCLRGTRIHIEVEELATATHGEDDRNASKGLPADYTGGVNRIVVIEGVDRNCLVTTAASDYGCSPAQVPERLAFETEGRRRTYKRVEELENEVAMFMAMDLQAEHLKWVQSGDKHCFTAFRHRYDSSPSPLTILTAIHSAWSSSPNGSDPHLVALVSSGLHTSLNNAVILVFGSDETEVKEIGEKLKSKGIKGGGRRKWSGKSENWKAVGGDEWIIELLQAKNVVSSR